MTPKLIIVLIISMVFFCTASGYALESTADKPSIGFKGNNKKVRGILDRVYERREFNRLRDSGLIPDPAEQLEKIAPDLSFIDRIGDAIRRFVRWLEGLFESNAPPQGPTTVSETSWWSDNSKVVFWLCLGVVLVVFAGLLAWQIWKEKKAASAAALTASGGGKKLPEAGDGALAQAIQRDASEWRNLWQEALEQGNFGEAFRCLYLELLSELNKKRAVAYRKGITNWEAWETYRGKEGGKSSYKKLTAAFDKIHYGGIKPNRSVVENAAKALDLVLQEAYTPTNNNPAGGTSSQGRAV